MEKLIQKYYQKLDRTKLLKLRSQMFDIDWSNRFIGIKGARGAGKTTLLFQYILLKQLPTQETLYVSLDDLYFTENSIFSLAEQFVNEGGKYLLIDEVHRYANWSSELKNIYDDFPDLQVVFTGSSLIHIENARGDLSRRAVVYELHGLSFREFLAFQDIGQFDKLSLDDILNRHVELARPIVNKIKPLSFFKDYLTYGYFPYYLENKDAYLQKLMETILIALSTDLPSSYNLSYASVEKIKQLLHILAESVPFKPNITKLSERIGVARNSLLDFLRYLEELRIVKRLYADTKGIGLLQKPEKLYLNHPNIFYALSYQEADKGSIRESFFINQVSVVHPIEYSAKGDFKVGKDLFEIGGKSKSQKQIQNEQNAYIIADNIEIGHKNKIPLWLFGFLY
ncbi:ATP-binding protein [Belliella aquatica]|uniref:ATPase AAA n=1 Tax=Belliella aquatica TaxID=1323734 RepID=A0ABQ1N2I2_9BACT|nr:AAA family ATPase [Belliella aquatica]MCH7407109.1 AAA family ATPase [Belliella aquatica]GGC52104.1 ATPase AAA [Belliella aquatica]